MSTIEQITTRNSTYEVDRENKRVRRVAGVNAPTAYQGEDGEWQSFYRLDTGPHGTVIFLWDRERWTQTSTVLERKVVTS